MTRLLVPPPVPHGVATPPTHGALWWRRFWHGSRRVWERPDWASYVGADWTGRIMDAEVTDDFHAKQGRSTGRWVLERGGADPVGVFEAALSLAVVAGAFGGAVASPGTGRRPCRNFATCSGPGTQGLPVPEVVAAGEFVGPWGKLQSFLAIEELAGMLRLAPGAFRWRRGSSIRSPFAPGRRAWRRRWPG